MIDPIVKVVTRKNVVVFHRVLQQFAFALRGKWIFSQVIALQSSIDLVQNFWGEFSIEFSFRQFRHKRDGEYLLNFQEVSSILV